MVNEVRFGYAHYYQTFFGTDASQDPANYNFNGQTYQIPHGYHRWTRWMSYGGAPGLRISASRVSEQATDRRRLAKDRRPDGVIEFLDHVSILKGKHAFKVGGEFI